MSMKKNYRIFAFLGVLIVFVLIVYLLVGNKTTSNNSQIDEITLRLPIPITDGGFVPYYIAQEKGFFEKYNLKVKLEPGSTELNPIKMVSQGIDQFGVIGGPELLMTGRSKNAPIIAIGLLHVNANFVVILTKQDSKYKTLADLQGQRVGFNYGHISTDVLRSLFRQENISVTEEDVGFNYNLFLADKIPAQWAFSTTAGVTLREQGHKLNEISPADYGIITHGHTIITNEKLIKENPDLVQRFMSAIIEATAYSVDHVDECVDIIVKRDNNFSRTLAHKQLEINNKTILNNSKILWVDENLLKDTRDRLEKLEIIPSSFSIGDSYDNSFLNQYYQKQ